MLTCRDEDKYNQKYTQDKRWKLRAAGGKSASSTHAQDFTANLRFKAGTLGESRVLAQFCNAVIFLFCWISITGTVYLVHSGDGSFRRNVGIH